MRELKSDVLVTNEKIQGEFFSSKKQDLKVSMVLIIDAESYNGEKKLEYDGIEYAIIRTYEREDGLLEVTCGEK